MSFVSIQPPLFLSFIFTAHIRHYFPGHRRMVETAAGFTASRDFHPSQDLCELPPLLAAVAGQEYHYVLTASWQNSPPQAAFRTDRPACHLILAVIYGSVFTAAGESSRIFRCCLPRLSRPVRKGISTFGYSVFKLQVRKAFVLACIGEEAYGLTTLKMQFSKIF